MAKHEVTIVACDKCGHEEKDEGQFYHVIVTGVKKLDKKGKVQIFTDRDLCESCVGMPGVNRDV